MLTLCIDTAYKYLTCALIEDEQILASVSLPCFKKQYLRYISEDKNLLPDVCLQAPYKRARAKLLRPAARVKT